MDFKKIPKNKFLLIAGPCAIEGEEIAFEIANKLVNISLKFDIPLVFKGSYKKQTELKLIVLPVLVMLRL